VRSATPYGEGACEPIEQRRCSRTSGAAAKRANKSAANTEERDARLNY
jgi:hypothetical protein